MLIPIAIGAGIGFYVLRGKTGDPPPMTDDFLSDMANAVCEGLSNQPPPFQTVDAMAAAIGKRAYPELDWPPRFLASEAHKAVWAQLRLWSKQTQDAAAQAGYADVCAFLNEQGVAPPVPPPPDPVTGQICIVDEDGDELCFDPGDLPADLGGGSSVPSIGGQAVPQVLIVPTWDTDLWGGGSAPMQWSRVAAFWYLSGVRSTMGPIVDPNGASCPRPGTGSRGGCVPSSTVSQFQKMWNITQNYSAEQQAKGGALAGISEAFVPPMLQWRTIAVDGILGGDTLQAMSRVKTWQEDVSPGVGSWKENSVLPAQAGGGTSGQ